MTLCSRASGLLCVLVALLFASAPVLAEDNPFGPAEEQGFLRKEADQRGGSGGGGGVSSPASAPGMRAAAAAEKLEGLFKADEGQCGGGAITAGSYFRMVQPGAQTIDDGPFVENNDSPCGDKSYTALKPGTDEGLSTSGYQAQNDPPFDATGNGTTDKIVQPQGFFGTRFAVATNQVDPQSGNEAAIPTVTNDGGTLSGDVRAFAAAWNNQHFNQGSPKPDGGTPGLTSGPTGTLNEGTKKYTLEWSSTIVGGPFNNFTGVWHLEGTFEGGVVVGTQSVPSQTTGGGGGGGAAVQGAGASGSRAGGVAGATPRTGPTDLATVAGGLGVVGLAGLWRWAGLRVSRRRERRG